MNITQSVKNLVKDEQKPLFKLAEILMCEVADSLKREFQKFNEENQKDFPLTIEDLNSKRYITVPKKLTEYAKLYDLAGELMAACDQIYVNHNDFDAIKVEFLVTVGRTDMQPLSPEHSGLGRNVPYVRFKTIEDAENFISGHLMNIDKEAVERGDFFLDAPEEMVNAKGNDA